MTRYGDEQRTGRGFLRGPNGVELSGPRFSPDGNTLIIAVQHPGDGDRKSLENPPTRW